ncbi:PREDICTED: uncharacterized protein LOC106820406, partial [Priapulus caudatus]|uniref:Uncharacterized protein LOC106820406 n=1 Tax=Priapulus caudatus TaxID=37621 RepID=A0ABM1F7J1_PRICU
DEPQYWLIGVIVGAVVALAFIIWCSLFIYYKCLKPHPAGEPGEPHLVSIKNKRYYVQDIGIDNPARDVENQLVPRSPPQLRSRAHYDVSATPVLSGKIAKNYIDGVRLGLSEKEHIIDSAYDDAGTSGDTSSEHHETKPTATSEITHEVDKSEGENEEDLHIREDSRLGVDREHRTAQENRPKLPKTELVRTTPLLLEFPPPIAIPLTSTRLENDLRYKEDMERFLQEKVELEKWRNKQQQKEKIKRKEQLSHRQPVLLDGSQSSVGPPTENKKKKHRRHTHHRRHHRPDTLSVSPPLTAQPGITTPKTLPDAEKLYDALHRMHDLLDEAFSLPNFKQR